VSETKQWDFDQYDWLDEYDTRWRASHRLCYEATLGALPALTGARPEDTVLDIGAGTGNSALPFLELGCCVLGVDPSEEMLRRAVSKMAPFGERCRMRHVDDPFLRLPLDEERFDIIISAYALHHLSDEHKRIGIAGMKATLKPGGRIAIADTMFRDEAHKAQALREDNSLEDEYQPLLATFPGMFEAEGLAVALHQMGPLVWVLVATSSPASPR